MPDDTAASRPPSRLRRRLFGLAAVLLLLVTGAPFSSFGVRVFVATLVVALVPRAVYVALRRRARPRLLSGWVFVIALALIGIAWAGAHGRAVQRASRAAVRQGVVATESAATPADRCVGIALEKWDRYPQGRPPGLTKETARAYWTLLCRRAADEDALHDDGIVDRSALRRLSDGVALELWREGLWP